MLSTLLTRIPENPGLFTAVEHSSNSTIAAVGITIGICIVIAGFMYGTSNYQSEVVAGTAILCIFASTGLAYLLGEKTEGPTAAEYDEAVSEWLSDVYGIHISDDEAAELRDGDSLAVEFNGEPVVIEFVNTAGSDDLAVRSTGGQLLAPLTVAE